ncbi:DUF2199 domain-containing protein [soil metagenome]
MKIDFEFQCHTCSQIHKGMPTFGWEYPISVLDIPLEERNERVDLGSDDCVIDEKWFFVRGCIEIPVIGLDEPFIWGTWVSLSEKSYERFVELYEAEERETEPPFFGWLNHTPPGYPFQALYKTMVHLRPFPTRPLIELEPTEHPLWVEQRNGVTIERLKEIVETILHGKDTENA